MRSRGQTYLRALFRGKKVHLSKWLYALVLVLISYAIAPWGKKMQVHLHSVRKGFSFNNEADFGDILYDPQWGRRAVASLSGA